MSRPLDIGARIRLLRTDDPYTKLQPGALGVVTAITESLRKRQIHIQWDTGSSLALIDSVDDFEIVS